MTPDQLEKLTNIIQDTIKITVNGKIDKMSSKLDTYIVNDTRDKDDIKRQLADTKEATVEWRTSITPSINSMKQIQDFSTTSIFLLKLIGLMAGAFAAVYAAIKYFK